MGTSKVCASSSPGFIMMYSAYKLSKLNNLRYADDPPLHQKTKKN